MGLWSRLTGKLRLRGVLSDNAPEDADEVQQVRLLKPKPTPTGRVPKRPEETPSAKPREIGGTAGTRSYGGQGGTPSTRRIHNPTHIR
jgi:hypothetical protein